MIKNIFIKRLAIILITIILGGLMIATPAYLNSEMTINHYLSTILMISSFVLVSWSLNITFSVYFIQAVKSIWWKWTFSTICLILVFSAFHSITRHFFFRMAFPDLLLFRVLVITLVNTVVFSFNMMAEINDTNLKIEDENTQLKISWLKIELEQLKNQTNPHFLFNALSSLKFLISVNPQITERYLIKLSEFLRVSIRENKDLVSLDKELYLCSNYIYLQKMHFQEGLIYETKIDQNSQNNRIPFFALQMLVENALKHNIVSLVNPLNIRVEVNGNILEVSNNIQALLLPQSSSKTGLQNLNERMKILTGQPIIITEDQQFFKVQFALLNP